MTPLSLHQHLTHFHSYCQKNHQQIFVYMNQITHNSAQTNFRLDKTSYNSHEKQNETFLRKIHQSELLELQHSHTPMPQTQSTHLLEFGEFNSLFILNGISPNGLDSFICMSQLGKIQMIYPPGLNRFTSMSQLARIPFGVALLTSMWALLSLWCVCFMFFIINLKSYNA